MSRNIVQDLFSMQDHAYADFQRKLIPTISPERVIGVRMPALRSYAKKLFRSGEYWSFLQDLPHHYYEENNLHGILIGMLSSYDECFAEHERFLPFIDNWATCDLLRPACFSSHKEQLISEIPKWLHSGHGYTIRFGMEMLLLHYLEEAFRPEFLRWVGEVDSKEYYVNMMAAWYFSTALAFQHEETVRCLEEHQLSRWVHNKTIQKAVESYRIAPERKEYLRTLRIK